MSAQRIRLMEVRVEPVFVLDDGENLTNVPREVKVIPASEWPTYSSLRFPRELDEWQQRLDKGDDE